MTALLARGDIPLPICICLVTGSCHDATSGPHPAGCCTQPTAFLLLHHVLQGQHGVSLTEDCSRLCSLLQLRKQMLNGCPQVYRADSWMVGQTPVLFVPQACDVSAVNVHHLPTLPQLGSSSALVTTHLHSFHILIS